MATVLARSDLAPPAPARDAEIVAFPKEPSSALVAREDPLVEEARAGAERLMAMNPDQLRQVIAERVALLEGELREREARRAALDEARAAQRLLDQRRRRAIRIRRRVNMASSMIAASFACFILVSII